MLAQSRLRNGSGGPGTPMGVNFGQIFDVSALIQLRQWGSILPPTVKSGGDLRKVVTADLSKVALRDLAEAIFSQNQPTFSETARSPETEKLKFLGFLS